MSQLPSSPASELGYPADGERLLNPNRKFKPNVLRAVKKFRRSKPWRGTDDERFVKFEELNRDLAEAYGITAPNLAYIPGGQGNGIYSPEGHAITLYGHLSVVTYLHEFGHAVFGREEYKATKWSVNLFARCFPRSFARCRFEGHVLRKVRDREPAIRPGVDWAENEVNTMMRIPSVASQFLPPPQHQPSPPVEEEQIDEHED